MSSSASNGHPQQQQEQRRAPPKRQLAKYTAPRLIEPVDYSTVASYVSHSVDHKFLAEPKTAAIIPVAFSGGQPKMGVEEGPHHMLQFGVIDQVKELGWQVEFDGKLVDYHKLQPAAGDDADIGVLKQPRFVSLVTQKVANVVEAQCAEGNLAVTLGGDHSIALGTISGSARVHPDVCVIWIDAHADINTPLTTETGNIHGCPVSWLMGLADNSYPFEWTRPVISPDSIVYIGLRDVDEPERRILRSHGIKAFSMHEVDRYGIGKVVEMALDHVNPNRDRPIHLSFDVDALDPTVAPSTGTPVRGGLTFREGHYICETIHETGLLVALDIMEVNPQLGDDEMLHQTVTVGCSLVRSSLGETLL